MKYWSWLNVRFLTGNIHLKLWLFYTKVRITVYITERWIKRCKREKKCNVSVNPEIPQEIYLNITRWQGGADLHYTVAELTYDNTFTIVLSLCMCRKCREFILFHRKSWLRGQEAGKIKGPCWQGSWQPETAILLSSQFTLMRWWKL